MVEVESVYGTGGQFLNAARCDEQDLWGKQLTIKSATVQEIRNQRKIVIGFKEIEDTLPLNKTNALILAEVFGNDTAYWMGMSIKLRKTKRQFQGRMVDAIEVEPVKAKKSKR